MLKLCHETNNHPGSERTLLFFLKNFYSGLTRTELHLKCQQLCNVCPTCLLSKPNRSTDRGLISSLPIPPLANDTLYLDFVQMDMYNNFDYVLTVVDSLTHFVQFCPCQKSITGEGVVKILLERWISAFGKPSSLHSDNDVRFRHEKGFIDLFSGHWTSMYILLFQGIRPLMAFLKMRIVHFYRICVPYSLRVKH